MDIPMIPITDEKRSKLYSLARPGLWAECYPNAYIEDQRYFSAKSVSVDLCGLLGLAEGFVEDGDQIIEEGDLECEVNAAAHLAAAGVPTYFVRPEQVDLFSKGSEAVTIDWKTIRLPVECAAFVLPRDAITHSQLGPIRFVWFARIRKDSEVALPSGTNYVNPEGDFFVIHTSVAVPDSTATRPMTIVWVEEDGTEATLDAPRESPNNEPYEDDAIIFRLARIALGMTSLLETDPEQVERGIVTAPKGPTQHEKHVWERWAAEARSNQPAGKYPFQKVGRNELCPCGNGKKYKKCHGAPRPEIHYVPATLPGSPLPPGIDKSLLNTIRVDMDDALKRAAVALVKFDDEVEGFVRDLAKSYRDGMEREAIQAVGHGLGVLTATKPGVPKTYNDLVPDWGNDSSERQRNIYALGRKAAGIEGMPIALFFQFETWATDNAEPDLTQSIAQDPLRYEQVVFLGTTPDGRSAIAEIRCKRGDNNRLLPDGDVKFGSTVKPETGVVKLQNTLAMCFYKGWIDAMSEEMTKKRWSNN
jgi:hypothetical protein